jgi:DNA-binding MarR family transcriptional regulator
MILQVTSRDGRVRLKAGARRATLLMQGKKVGGFDVLSLENMTAATARELAAAEPEALVLYEQASPEARSVLREAGISYAGQDGELYLHQPPIHVELPGRRNTAAAAGPSPFAPSPFAPKASRIPRWLLLHDTAEPSFRELSDMTALSESLVSRSVRALADDRLVEIAVDPRDSRSRRVRVRDNGTLLDAFERSTRRRTRGSTWEIGARDPQRALARLRRVAKRASLSYALGGLAGAAFVQGVVEPAEVDAWIDRRDHDRWIEELDAVPSRPAPGRLTLRVLPDPYVLSFAFTRDGLTVADPVQLYLDCRRAGERALEAAEAIRSEMGW